MYVITVINKSNVFITVVTSETQCGVSVTYQIVVKQWMCLSHNASEPVLSILQQEQKVCVVVCVCVCVHVHDCEEGGDCKELKEEKKRRREGGTKDEEEEEEERL